MPDEIINKYVSIKSSAWKKLKDFASLPENGRIVGRQGGLIIEEFFASMEESNNEKK